MSALLSGVRPAPQGAHASWARLATYIRAGLGLDYPPRRHADLARAFAPAAQALGFDEPADCIDWLLAQAPSRRHWQLLAQHLAVGETYFFRDPQQLQAIAEHVLAPLIAARNGGPRRLRLWSAGCSSGEEAYTLAMLARRLLPELEPAGWQLDIAGTDLRADALAQAATGLYGDWSFRGMPQGLRQQHFQAMGDGRLQVKDDIRLHTRFAQLNLVDDLSAWAGTGFDLIVCRNVLMYFSAEQARSVAASLHACLSDGGWLVVGACELPTLPWAGYEQVLVPGAVLLRKPAVDRPASAPMPLAPLPTPLPAPPAVAPQHDAATIRALADQGRSHEALVLCERWLQETTPDAAAHHLHAMILQEHGASADNIQAALQRALHCEPGFVLAHFALGHLARREARSAQARQHFAAVQQLLAQRRPEQMVDAGDGLTVAALAEVVATLALQEQAL